MDKIDELIDTINDSLYTEVDGKRFLGSGKGRMLIEQFLSDQKEPLSEPLKEFVKVFPPPYRYEPKLQCLVDSAGEYVQRIYDDRLVTQLWTLICTLLNKHINEETK